MRRSIILLFAVILLYAIPSVVLQAIYGPSYGFLSGEDCWIPDGQGGWVKHGAPASPMPAQPSVEVPLGVRYVPIFFPAAVLILFLFTPLSRKLDSKPPAPEVAEAGGEGEPPAPRPDDAGGPSDAQKPPD